MDGYRIRILKNTFVTAAFWIYITVVVVDFLIARDFDLILSL